jgi:hypothetical protein
MNDFADLEDILDPDRTLQANRTLARPLKHSRRGAKRQFKNGLKKQALNHLIPVLPPPDVDLYVVGNGAGAEKMWEPGGIDQTAFDFGTFIPHVVDLMGAQGCIAWVSTWTMNRNHALTMIEMLDDGRLGQLTVFTDPYFQRREASVFAELVLGLDRHPESARYLAFKNHVKTMCIATPDESRTVTITGSANLSAQPRCEQYVLTTAPDVYNFFKTEFFLEMLNG